MDTTEFQNQPWFSNNDYLEIFLDSIGYPAAGQDNRIVGVKKKAWNFSGSFASVNIKPNN